MTWMLLVALGGLIVLAGITFAISKRRSPKAGSVLEDNAFDRGAQAVERITTKFPGLHRQHSKANDKTNGLELGLQGNLTQTPLPDLLQYLSLGRKSGILELTCGRRTGRVIMKDGRVAKHFYRGKEDLDAMFMMLELAEGDFEFSEHIIEEKDSETNLEVVDIIMLWMDRKPKKKSASK